MAFNPTLGLLLSLRQTMIGKDAILSHDRYDVRGYADRNQVQ